MTQPNRFTKMLHERGFKVADFLQYWDVTRRTYERWCADSDSHDKLIKMIRGME